MNGGSQKGYGTQMTRIGQINTDCLFCLTINVFEICEHPRSIFLVFRPPHNLGFTTSV